MVHAVRMARRVVRDRGAVLKLFDELAPRFFGRPGGYTRIVKLPQRPGDAAPMSLLELMPEEGGAVGQAGGQGRQGPSKAPARTRRPARAAKAAGEGRARRPGQVVGQARPTRPDSRRAPRSPNAAQGE